MRAVGLLVLAALVAPAAVSADSFTPVRLTVKVAPLARSDKPINIRFSVSADPSVLDVRQGPVRAAVKLTPGECGGTFDGTSGSVLLNNQALSPQPSPGRAYSGTVAGGARVRTYTTYTVCAYLDDDYEQLATQTGQQTVTVSRTCTRAADTYDRALRNRHVSRARRSALGRSAKKACGSGVTL